MVMWYEGRDNIKHHRRRYTDLNLMDGRLLGVDTATREARSTSSDARSKAGILLMGPEEDPKPLATT